MTRRFRLELVLSAIGVLAVTVWVYRDAIEGWALSLGAGVLAWRILAAQAGIARPGRRSFVSRIWAPLEAGVLAWLVIRVRGIGRAKRVRIPAEACSPIGVVQSVYTGRDLLAEKPRRARGDGPGDEIPF